MWYILCFTFFPFSSNEIKSVPKRTPTPVSIHTRYQQDERELVVGCIGYMREYRNTDIGRRLLSFRNSHPFIFVPSSSGAIWLASETTVVGSLARSFVWLVTQNSTYMPWCDVSLHLIFVNFIVDIPVKNTHSYVGFLAQSENASCLDLYAACIISHICSRYMVHILIYVSPGVAVLTSTHYTRILFYFWVHWTWTQAPKHIFDGRWIVHVYVATEQWSAWVKENDEAHTIDVLAR